MKAGSARTKKPAIYLPELGREGVMRACEELLAAERIRCFRMNSGDQIITYLRKDQSEGRRRIRGHKKGTPDLLMMVALRFPGDTSTVRLCATAPVWIETKSSLGGQSPEQMQFQREAESNGEVYLLINDPSQLQAWLQKYRVRESR